MTNTNIQIEEIATTEVKFLFARENARKHGHQFANAEDEKVATQKFESLSDEDKRYWLDHVFEIERKMVKFGTKDLRIFYPNNTAKAATDRRIIQNFCRRGSRA